MNPTQFVVVHSPGPSWKAGVPAFEQEGLQLHVAHYSQLLEQGKLVMVAHATLEFAFWVP